MTEEEETIVLVPSCRGQMMYRGSELLTFRIWLTEMGVIESEMDGFEDYLRNRVKYASCAAPGVCAMMPHYSNIHVIAEAYSVGGEGGESDFDYACRHLKGQYYDFIRRNQGLLEDYFQSIREIPYWSEYELSLDFPNKIQRFFPHPDPKRLQAGTMKLYQFTKNSEGISEITKQNPNISELGVSEPNAIILGFLTEEKPVTTLAEILLTKFRENPNRPVHYFDSSCSKLLQEPPNYSTKSEGVDETRLPSGCRPSEEELPLTKEAFESLRLPRPKDHRGGGKKKRKNNKSKKNKRKKNKRKITRKPRKNIF